MKQPGKPAVNGNTLLMISSIYHSLTKAEKKVADIVQSNPQEAVYYTVTDLAEKAAVGETSVIRFCRKLGYRGYHDFKLAMAQDVVQLPAGAAGGEPEESDDVLTVARKMTESNTLMLQNTLNLLDPEAMRQAVRAITEARKLYIYGVGSSGITAMDAHYRLMRIGIDVEVQRDAHIIAMSAALVKKGDAVLGISTSGSTKDLVDPIQRCKENGATVICLTSHARSPITGYADHILLIPAREKPTEGGSLSTKIVQIHMLDMLCKMVEFAKKDEARQAIKKTAEAVADKLY